MPARRSDGAAAMPGAIRDSTAGVLLDVHVQPGAKRTEFAGMHGDALKIRVAAPPVDGAANTALCDYVAARMGVARKSVTVLRGQSGRRKQLLISGTSAARVAAVLAAGE